MTGAFAFALSMPAFNTVLAALQHLADAQLGHAYGLGRDVAREASLACYGHARLMRVVEIAPYQAHLRRAYAHQRAQGGDSLVLILDPAQYATLWAALWLYQQAGLADPARRGSSVAALAAGESRGLTPVKALRDGEVCAFLTSVKEVGRPAAWV